MIVLHGFHSTVDTTELLRSILNNSEPGIRPNVDGNYELHLLRIDIIRVSRM